MPSVAGELAQIKQENEEYLSAAEEVKALRAWIQNVIDSAVKNGTIRTPFCCPLK